MEGRKRELVRLAVRLVSATGYDPFLQTKPVSAIW
jgi:hypothetical protein